MAFNNNVWESRSDGNTANGGAYNSSVSGAGTDYTQSSTPILTLTDLAAAAAHNTNPFVVTSVTGGFTSAMIGNAMGIESAGTFWQSSRVMITGYTDTNTVTVQNLDGVVTIVSGGTTPSGGKARVGGAVKGLANITGSGTDGKAYSELCAGDKVWVKSGTHTDVEIYLQNFGTDSNFTEIEGYTTTRGDGAPTRPVIQLAARSGTVGFVRPFKFMTISNIIFDANGNQDNCCEIQAVDYGVMFYNCKFMNGVKWGVYDNNSTPAVYFDSCEITLNRDTPQVAVGFPSSGGVYNSQEDSRYYNCDIHDNQGPGMYVDRTIFLDRCRVYNNQGPGLYRDTNQYAIQSIINNDFAYNDLSGVVLEGAGTSANTIFENNLFISNGVYGIQSLTVNMSGSVHKRRFGVNGFYGNSSGAGYQVPSSLNVTLTGDPYTNGPSGDFTKNNTSGAGAATKAVGDPLYLDLGSLQSQCPAPSPPPPGSSIVCGIPSMGSVRGR